MADVVGVDAADDLLELFEGVERERATTQHEPAPLRDPRAEALLEALALVSVTIDGVRDARGSVRVLAFADAAAWDAFDLAQASGYGTAPAQAGSVTITLRAADAGPYAVFAFHDADDDEELDRRAGRPHEGYGYSGAIDPWLPPPFARAATVGTDGHVRLNYPDDARRR
ncbi:MAG: DUF2141 domain-containing protein [Gammaproteobacteria bacterium]